MSSENCPGKPDGVTTAIRVFHDMRLDLKPNRFQ
jgi:hypothetical protein